MLHRRIKTRLRERGDWFADLADSVIDFNAWIRDNTPFNLGPIVFFPIHSGMGGRMRYLISGGSALSEKVQKDLHGLGFTVLEGYGLTESSPVLTVARPGNKLLRGSVGKPLPGVEVKIDSPDENGIGEVLARGQNVMLGYFNNEEATEAVLQDRWLKQAIWASSTKTGICILSDARKMSLLTRTAKYLPGRNRRHLRKILVDKRIIGCRTS
jgi:long-chain acyl-CoA synthetase